MILKNKTSIANQIFINKVFVTIVLMFFCLFQVNAQIIDTIQKDDYCVPALKGVPVGKGLAFEYQVAPNITIISKDRTGNFGDSKNTISSNSAIEVKLKIPIINKPYLSILGGVKYKFEEYHFDKINTNPFYNGLEDKGLKRIGLDMTVVKPTRSKRFWVLRAEADLNGDYDNGNNNLANYLKFSISPALGWKVNDNFSYAVGGSFNYRFGNPLIVPVFAFNLNLNERWGVEAILPVFIKSRYQINNGLRWLNALEIDGASYKLEGFETLSDSYNNLHLHRSDIQFTTKMEKRIVGWLWVASEIGFRENLTYNLTNSNKSTSKVIFENSLNTAFLFNVSLFISPHKKNSN